MDKPKNISDKDNRTGIELYNRGVADILGDPPVWLIHTGSHTLYGILFLLLLGAAFISYPDVVKGPVLIEDTENVNWITANSSGKIDRFFVRNDSLVKKGDTIGIIQNPARLSDVKKFTRILSNVERYYLTNNTDLLRAFPFDLVMGEMAESYKTFTQAVRNCLIYDDYNSYFQRKAFLQKEQHILKKDPEKNELAILKIDREIFELSLTHKMEVEKNRKQLELAYEDIVNSIKKWESNYIIRSNNEGRVVLGEVRDLAQLVNIGDTICTVISGNEENFIGKMYLSQEKVAGVEYGNTVNIKLSKYPSHTFGVLVGEITSISFVPYYKMYSIDIIFPNKLMTSARKEIKYELGLKGEAEIVTSNRSVLSRIFNPIYNIFNDASESKII